MECMEVLSQNPNIDPMPPDAYAIGRIGGCATASNCVTVYSPSESKESIAPWG